MGVYLYKQNKHDQLVNQLSWGLQNSRLEYNIDQSEASIIVKVKHDLMQ